MLPEGLRVQFQHTGQAGHLELQLPRTHCSGPTHPILLFFSLVEMKYARINSWEPRPLKEPPIPVTYLLLLRKAALPAPTWVSALEGAAWSHSSAQGCCLLQLQLWAAQEHATLCFWHLPWPLREMIPVSWRCQDTFCSQLHPAQVRPKLCQEDSQPSPFSVTLSTASGVIFFFFFCCCCLHNAFQSHWSPLTFKEGRQTNTPPWQHCNMHHKEWESDTIKFLHYLKQQTLTQKNTASARCSTQMHTAISSSEGKHGQINRASKSTSRSSKGKYSGNDLLQGSR